MVGSSILRMHGTKLEESKNKDGPAIDSTCQLVHVLICNSIAILQNLAMLRYLTKFEITRLPMR